MTLCTGSVANIRLLLAGADVAAHAPLLHRLRQAGYGVSTASGMREACERLSEWRPQLLLSTAELPDGDGLALLDAVRERYPVLPFILLAARASIAQAVEAVSRGVAAYLPMPVAADDLLARVAAALQWSGAVAAADELAAWRSNIVSQSPRMEGLLAEARLVAATSASVLLQGESGTGKELLARAIHRASPRAAAPFIAINCGAIPENLLESELFGHRRGAFTGATSDQPGLFRHAHGGTLFLDEIGDMPLALQVKLLRVLQEQAVRPLGGSRAEAVDVRIISATHRDLERALMEGRFREDLYYRLNVVSLTLPALCERREDIPLLAAHFLAAAARRFGRRIRGFAPDARELLLTASWPGNIRQLHNVVEQACALSTTPLIPRRLVERALHGQAAASCSYAEAKRRFELDYLVALLKLTGGNVSDAARLAGRNRTEFYRLLQRNGLHPEHYRRSAGDPAADGMWS